MPAVLNGSVLSPTQSGISVNALSATINEDIDAMNQAGDITGATGVGIDREPAPGAPEFSSPGAMSTWRDYAEALTADPVPAVPAPFDIPMTVVVALGLVLILAIAGRE